MPMRGDETYQPDPQFLRSMMESAWRVDPKSPPTPLVALSEATEKQLTASMDLLGEIIATLKIEANRETLGDAGNGLFEIVDQVWIPRYERITADRMTPEQIQEAVRALRERRGR